MTRESTRSARPFAMARFAARTSYRHVSNVWMVENPLPLLRQYVRLYQLVTGREFSDADPFGLIHIDPLEVTHISNRVKTWDPWLGEVVGGDWDRRGVPIDEIPIVRIIESYVREDEPLDCSLYRQYYAEEHRRLEPFEVRCQEVAALIDDIDRRGYRSQRELLKTESVYTLQRENNDTIHPLLNEIRVDIDRHGRFHHWRCGLHRLSVARALDISTVPVLVGTRHTEWQTIRDQFRRASSAGELSEELREYVGHPDLRGLLEES